MAGIADRNEMTTGGQAVRRDRRRPVRPAGALAYAEEQFLIGNLKKASGLMALARGYQSLAKLMPKPEGE